MNDSVKTIADSIADSIPSPNTVTNPTSSIPDVLHPSATYSYLALGDSYTIGESVTEKERWSVQLVEMLQKEGLSINTPDIIAQTGWTTSELAAAIKPSGNDKTYSIVSLLIGVNNQYRGQSIDNYRKEFESLLNTAITFANNQPSKVFVLSIPDWGVTPFAASGNQDKIKSEIDAFNLAALEICNTKEILFIDITELSRLAKNQAHYIAEDSLHFSGSMYKLWVEKALPEVKKLLLN